MLQKLREKMKRTQRGAIMVFFAILVPLFLGMIGFAIDAGFLYMQKAKLQDIADAAALAGAGHLNDGDDGSKTRLAVRKFAEENGVAGTATSEVFIYDENYPANNNINLGTGDKLKLAMKVERNVMDKDNVQRDHVRVAIAKRVPTFFIRFLFPDEKEVIVRSVAAAEYVEGGAPMVSGDVPVIMVSAVSANDFQNYQSANNIVLGKNFALPIYISSGNIDVTKLPGTGNLYVNNISGSSATYDDKNKKVVWNPPINGREVYYSVGQYPTWGTDEYRKEADKIRKEADDKYNEVKNRIIQEANVLSNNLSTFKDGNIDNKRFIGVDGSGRPISNIKETDTEIDLYISGTYFETTAAEPSVFLASARSVITNRQLKNVKKINTLVSDKPCMIGTSGITYGNIYCLNWSSLVIAGQNNKFNGSIYTPSNLYVGGENNRFLGDSSSSSDVSLLGQSVYLGKWNPITETVVNAKCYNFITGQWSDGECVKIDYNNDQFVDAKNDPNWHIYFGYDSTGSSSSGSSGSDTVTKSRVRLVI